jgi:uncharacterized protein YjbI with pentapeptide repeats
VKLNGSYVRDAKFIGCKLIGINWLEASKQFSADFEDCMLNLSSFFGMNLKRRKIKFSMPEAMSLLDVLDIIITP